VKGPSFTFKSFAGAKAITCKPLKLSYRGIFRRLIAVFIGLSNRTTLSPDSKFNVPILAHYFRHFHFLDSTLSINVKLKWLVARLRVAITKIGIFADTHSRYSTRRSFLHTHRSLIDSSNLHIFYFERNKYLIAVKYICMLCVCVQFNVQW